MANTRMTGWMTNPLRSPDNDGGGFWDGASKKAADKAARAKEIARDPSGHAARRRSRRKRIALGVVGGFVLVLGLGVLFLPQIAGGLAPGIIAGQSGKAIPGAASVKNVSLSWGGPQRVDGLRVADASGAEILRADVEVSRGLLGLVRSNLDLGTVSLTGVRATVVRNADGTTNLERALVKPAKDGQAAKSPSTGGGSGGAAPTLPKGLRAALSLKDGEVNYTDLGTPANPADRGKPVVSPLKVTVTDIDVDAAIEPGKPATAKVNARARQEGVAGVPAAPGVAGEGRIVIEARLEAGWLDAEGRLRLRDAQGSAKVTATTLPLALFDAIAGPLIDGTTLKESLGDTLSATIDAKGSMREGTVTLGVESAGVQAAGAVSLKDNVVTVTTPLTARVTSAALTSLLPKVATQLREDPMVRLDALPGVSLAVDTLRARVNMDAGSVDLRGGALGVVVRADPVAGSLALVAGEAMKPLATTPLEVRVTSEDLSQGVRLLASTSATIDGQPAGTVAVDAAASGLLDAAGMVAKGLPGSVGGQVALRGISTALVQPFVGSKADLARNVGPTIDVNLTAATAETDALTRGGKFPPTNLDAAIRSAHVNIEGALRVEETMIRDRDTPLRVTIARAGSLASGFVDASTGWSLSTTDGQGAVALEVSNIRIERDAATGAIDPGNVAANVLVNASGLRATAAHAADAPVDVRQARITLGLKPGERPTLGASIGAAHQNAPFTINATLAAAGLLTRGADGRTTLTPATLKPIGVIELIEAPTTLARLAPPPPPSADTAGDAASDAAPSSPPLNVAQLVQDVLGPLVSARVETSETRGEGAAGSAGIAANATINSSNVAVVVRGSATETQLAVDKAGVQANVAPALVRTLLSTFAPGVEGVPQLRGPAVVYVEVDPMTVATSGLGKVDPSRVGTVKATVAIPGRTLVDGLKIGVDDGSGTPRTLAAVGVEDLRLTASVPVASLVAAALPEERETRLDLRAGVLGAGESRVATLAANLSAEVSRGKPAGPLAARVEVTDIDVRALEGFVVRNGELSQALGDRASATVVATMTPPDSALMGGSGGGGGAEFSPLEAKIDVEADIRAPRLRTEGLKATVDGGVARLTQPMRVNLTVPAVLANQYVAAPGPNGRRDPGQLALTEPVDVSLIVDTLRVPLGKVGEAGVRGDASRRLDAAVNFVVARAALAAESGQRVTLSGTSFSLRTPGEGEASTAPIPFRLAVAEAQVTDQPAVKNLEVAGTIENHSDAAGNLTPDLMILNARGNLPAFPTALIDSLAKQDGLLVDLLGPVVQVERLRLDRLPLTRAAELTQRGTSARATIDVAVRTERASGVIAGVLGDAVFTAQQPVEVGLKEVTDALAGRFLKGMPFLGKVTKTREDAPALMRATGLSVPLGNDMSRLNGEVVLDPGEARFEASDDFAGLLSELAMRRSGNIGQRLQPLTVSIKNGVATYQKWPIPLGEFAVETQGTVDLVQRRIDVLTWIPFGQLSGDASRLFGGGGLGRVAPVLKAADMVPFRTTGSLDNPTTKPDLELFAQTFIQNLSPEQAVKGLLDGLLRPPAQPAPTTPPAPAGRP